MKEPLSITSVYAVDGAIIPVPSDPNTTVLPQFSEPTPSDDLPVPLADLKPIKAKIQELIDRVEAMERKFPNIPEKGADPNKSG